MLATVSKANHLLIYDVHDSNIGRNIELFDRSRTNMMNNDFVFDISWDHKNCYLIAASSARFLRLWKIDKSERSHRVVTGSVFMIIEKSYGHVLCLSWSLANNKLATGYEDGSIVVFDAVEQNCH